MEPIQYPSAENSTELLNHLMLTADLVERLKTPEGVFYLYSSGSNYIEVFTPFNPDKPTTKNFLADFNRIMEYVNECENPFRFNASTEE